MAFGIGDLTGLLFRIIQNKAEIERLVAIIMAAFKEAKPLLDKVAPDLLHQVSQGMATPAVPGAKPVLVLSAPNFSMQWLQESLNTLENAGLEVDGEYGQATGDAIAAFQKKNGIIVDRWAGTETTSLIYKKLHSIQAMPT